MRPPEPVDERLLGRRRRRRRGMPGLRRAAAPAPQPPLARRPAAGRRPGPAPADAPLRIDLPVVRRGTVFFAGSAAPRRSARPGACGSRRARRTSSRRGPGAPAKPPGHRQLDQLALRAEPVSVRRARGAHLPGQPGSAPAAHSPARARLPDATGLPGERLRDAGILSGAPGIPRALLPLLLSARAVPGLALFSARRAGVPLRLGASDPALIRAGRQLFPGLPAPLPGSRGVPVFALRRGGARAAQPPAPGRLHGRRGSRPPDPVRVRRPLHFLVRPASVRHPGVFADPARVRDLEPDQSPEPGAAHFGPAATCADSRQAAGVRALLAAAHLPGRMGLQCRRYRRRPRGLGAGPGPRRESRIAALLSGPPGVAARAGRAPAASRALRAVTGPFRYDDSAAQSLTCRKSLESATPRNCSWTSTTSSHLKTSSAPFTRRRSTPPIPCCAKSIPGRRTGAPGAR